MQIRKSNTHNKLYKALKECLLEKEYKDIIIQDILDKSTIARSTFYAHYRTKDDIIIENYKREFKELFKNLKDNITLEEFKVYLNHIFDIFYNERFIIKKYIHACSNEYILNKTNDQLLHFIEIAYKNNIFRNNNLPKDLQIENLLNDFAFILFYWEKRDFSIDPHLIASYYYELNKV